jgi:nitrogen fixation-related uncharacterized protein
MMPLGVWVVVWWMAFVVATGVALLVYAWRTGQFRNVEEPKYRMLEDREPEDWPGRERRGRGADRRGGKTGSSGGNDRAGGRRPRDGESEGEES